MANEQSNWGWLVRTTPKAAVLNENKDSTHRKRLALILRYIASMHHSADAATNGISFVRECSQSEANELLGTDFFRGINNEQNEECSVLFSTCDFRLLSAMNSDGANATALFSPSPFSFYKASSSRSPSSYRERINNFTFSSSKAALAENDGRACWLRLTRLATVSPPEFYSQVVRDYLTTWKAQTGDKSFSELLTLDAIATAPKLTPKSSHYNEIKAFLRQYKKHLKKSSICSYLEPIYNNIFEWLQYQGGGGNSDCDKELVWGFGNARRMIRDVVINGPLIEVMVEVELARDGALLIRPRDHTGVALNREVVTALATATDGSSSEVLSNLYRSVSEMDTSQLSPGQPETYIKFLRRMAMELSSGGIFQSSSSSVGNQGDDTKLVVTDTWCLYSRKKARTTWARDASALEEQLLLNINSHTLKDNLPKASWVLTQGPGALDSLNIETSQRRLSNDTSQNYKNRLLSSLKSVVFGKDSAPSPKNIPQRPLFPLPTSDAQNRIADLLLTQNYPAVICEGPPGSGKTHTVANILCAYLCRGKRVLITSKGAPALSVLRQRLPKSVQELCVDVSTSETTGMRQLQQTVERLADRVSRASTEIEFERCSLLQHSIDESEKELRKIDDKLEMYSERKRQIIVSADGQRLAENTLSLIESAPWLMKTVAQWTVEQVRSFAQRAKPFLEDDVPINQIIVEHVFPPSDILISHVAAKSGEILPYISNAASKAIASLPVLGMSGTNQAQSQLFDEINTIQFNGHPPHTKEDWKFVLQTLRLNKAVLVFHREVMGPLIEQKGWPIEEVYVGESSKRRIKKCLFAYFEKILTMKEIVLKLNLSKEIQFSTESARLDRRRSIITMRMQQFAEELVEATVVTELSRMFSVEAESALIRFAQVAGKARFSRASAARVSQRQRRHRQEYLEAFEKCVRYIPCWVLTSSQICEYLPPELGLFDLVVIDESSQSDITVLPGMLRGKQWLIVGDGKQVSPTESFVSESQINSLRAALPESPFESSLLPGHSFFDLCAQAFPRGRVILSEHFRCAPEIIRFSNTQFYNSRLVPLRLPTSSERMTPSIVDIRIKDGFKSGKVNEKECVTIVKMVQELVAGSNQFYPRSIGIMSLVGNEQSRLIRRRLLDAIGPQKYKEHNILVGDPPTFQGAERDVIFLSLVCSPGSVPTQNQQMHAQRANVALSRARDRMILVRSIDCSNVPNSEDIKVPIIEFFEAAGESKKQRVINADNGSLKSPPRSSIISFRAQLESLVEARLRDQGLSVRRMGVVWNDAISVENKDSGLRVAVCVVCAGESKQEWTRMLVQQKSIERVGWKCLRVDALSMLLDFVGTFQDIREFISSSGVELCSLNSDEEDQQVSELIDAGQARLNVEDNAEAIIDVEDYHSASVVVISSDEDEDRQRNLVTEPICANAKTRTESEADTFAPEQFGDVVDLTFLRNEGANSTTTEVLGNNADESIHSGKYTPDPSSLDTKSSAKRNRSHKCDNAYLGDLSGEEDSDVSFSPKRTRRYHRRLDKYSRDGRWYPGRSRIERDEQEPAHDWYDTDSDLADIVNNHCSSNRDKTSSDFGRKSG